MKRVGLFAALLAVAATLWALDLHHTLTLTGMQSGLARWHELRDLYPLATGLGFGGLYVLVAALSIPGALILTLSAGALFGLFWGMVIVSFASSIGATLALLVSRYLLRDWVRGRYAARLNTIDTGIARDGGFYLFSLRLIPVFPFFIINLAMGLTAIRATTFYWVSQLGMIPATLVYVNAGMHLSDLTSLSGIVSPGLWLSFAAIGLLPWLARSIVGMAQRRRIYARFRKPTSFDRNLIVIGAGAAGLVSSYIAAAVKAKVTLVEAGKMGGDCLNDGCVPSKALIKSARVAHTLRHADHYGIKAVEVRFDFKQVMARVHGVIAAVAPHDSVERYTKLGVEVVQGYAKILDPWTVEIAIKSGETRRLTTRSIILATGARPFVPPLPGLDEVGYLTSHTVWSALAKMESPPARLVVLGGGPIGCELAQALARLGSQVVLIQRSDRLMEREDEEVSALAKAALEADGVQVLTAHEALRCHLEGGQRFIVVQGPQGEQTVAFDTLLCAVGRVPRLEGFGLEGLGVPTGRTVTTNHYLQTLYPNILAAGDVAGPYQFTHTAAHQAWYATVNALFGGIKRFKVDHSVIPRVTFIDPEVAQVGLNEQEARGLGIPFEVTRYNLDDLDRAITDGVARGFVKVLTPPGKDRILGVTIVGEHAGDWLAEYTLAMKHGLGLQKILATIHPYPTLAEANKYAAGQWKRNHAPQRLLTWAERYHRWMRRGGQ